MQEPTCEELIEALCATEGCEYNLVHSESDSSWRHGSYETNVFHRPADGTYWEATYRMSGDGEAHGLREGIADISRVYPKVVQTTVYVSELPENA